MVFYVPLLLSNNVDKTGPSPTKEMVVTHCHAFITSRLLSIYIYH
jgi:hypothetical protein